jgi:lysophospholipase L1-like esterase
MRSIIVCLTIAFGSLSLSPILIAAEAPAATKPAHDFARWEKAIAAFEQRDKTAPPPKGALLFIGSSTIAGWKTLAADFPDQQVINRGFGGSEIADSTHFAERIIFPYEPKMVFLRAGGNDIHGGKSAEQVFADFKQFAEKVHSKLPETEVVYIALSPAPARWEERDANKALNALAKEYAVKTPKVKYIETYEITLTPDGQARTELFVADKLHFNAEGYKLLAERVRAFLNTKRD